MFKQIAFLQSFSFQKEKLAFSFALISIFVFSQINFGQNPSDLTPLEKGKPIERIIKGGEKNFFQIKFSDNQFAKIIVRQRGIDVRLRRVYQEKIVAQYDFDSRTDGEEIVEMTVKKAGNYQIEIEPKQKNAAEGKYEIQIIELRDATEKDFAVDGTRNEIYEAIKLWESSDYAKALPLAEHALAVREKELGKFHFEVAIAYLVLGNIVGDNGDLQKCEEYYLKSAEVVEKVFGKEHIFIGSILNNLATLYSEKNEYEKAEVLLLQALDIREKYLTADNPLIAQILANLGNIYRKTGNIEKAGKYYERTLKIREKAFGAESIEVASSLNAMANLYNDFSKAEPLYLRALEIREKIYGAENRQVGETLYNLSILYAKAGNFAKAKEFGERTLKIFENQLGKEHQMMSYPLNLLALIYKNFGDYERSEEYFFRSISLKEKTYGANDPYLGGVFSNLSNLYALKGDIQKAVEFQAKANDILEYNVMLNLASGSESEKINYLKSLSGAENRTFSLNVLVAPNSTEAANLAATLNLRKKGRVLDAVSENITFLRRRLDPKDQILLDRLNEISAQLSQLITAGNNGISAEEFQKNVAELDEKRENLEIEIGRKSKVFFENKKNITLQNIQEKIPEDAALVEITVFDPILPQRSDFITEENLDLQTDQMRYIAYIIHKKGNVSWKDLGEVRVINEKIDLFRRALRDPKSRDVKLTAKALSEKVFQPIKDALGNAKHLLISPDGELNLIPFEALIGENERYLIEDYSISYLTSGRDLLRFQTVRENKNKPLIIANPQFGAFQENPKTDSGKSRKRNLKREKQLPKRNLSEGYFAPLNGTLQEARTIKEIFPESEILVGEKATETALKQINAPEILHIATHGFFLDNEEGTENSNIKIENPLLRSGLAFAGANERKKGAADDGVLTALESSGLNLWGTKLVVLSACDTGLGKVKNGEGVFGLRRAFILAGTDSLVMSLWSVSDYATRELMTDYYKNLKKGLTRRDSLRQVQLEMIKNPKRQHPFFWGSFIQSGEWANLDGKR